MKIFRVMVLGLMMVSSMFAIADDVITESEVVQMLSEMESAVKQRDVEKLTSYFTQDAMITIEMPAQAGGKMVISLAQYKAMLKQSWSMPAEFSYAVKDQVVTVADDGKSATASDTTLEKIVLNGQVVASSSTKESIDIVEVSGKPAISRLHGKVSL